MGPDPESHVANAEDEADALLTSPYQSRSFAGGVSCCGEVPIIQASIVHLAPALYGLLLQPDQRGPALLITHLARRGLSNAEAPVGGSQCSCWPALQQAISAWLTCMVSTALPHQLECTGLDAGQHVRAGPKRADPSMHIWKGVTWVPVGLQPVVVQTRVAIRAGSPAA